MQVNEPEIELTIEQYDFKAALYSHLQNGLDDVRNGNVELLDKSINDIILEINSLK